LNRHREILEKELETVGIRLNQKPPDVTVSKRKAGGGVRFASTVPQTLLGPDPEKLATQILREYKISSADVLAREEITVDQLVDVVLGKPCCYGNEQPLSNRKLTTLVFCRQPTVQAMPLFVQQD
jgi:ribosome-interacting GTPase 1